MKQIITSLLKEAIKKNGVSLRNEEIEKFIEIPPSPELGDYSFPCFFLIEKFKQEPSRIALDIRRKITKVPEGFQDIQTSGAYINFFVNRKDLSKQIIQEILSKKEKYGSFSQEKNKVMIEFSQPNTHKAFHVGHIRGTTIGESLARIFEFCGNEVIRANYQGDSGMHVAKWIWCYKKYHKKQKLKEDESWIASIYVDAIKRLSKNEKLQEQVDLINKMLAERSDKELDSLWKKSRKLSLDSFEKIYRELNTHFDVYFFESEMEKRGLDMAEKLLKDEIAKISEGAVIIDLKKYNLGVWVLLRKDQTVLYSAKDLALVKEKFEKFKINRNVYVIGSAQSMHMAQLFKTLELMNFPKVKECKYVPFSEVRLPTGKMSSRTGENILYSDFIKEITDYSKKEIKKRFPSISKKELESRSLKISIASIKYSMLKQNPNKVIIFKKEDALNFEGDSGAYILYTYARAGSILEKANKKLKEKFDTGKLEEKEIELIKKLSQFKDVVSNAYKTMNPNVLANYSYQLCQIFNEFYHSCPVIDSEKEQFRLSLVTALRQVLKNSVYLLGISTVEEM
ncbi:MAG: arginine--tRNA ligase [Candidatus Pacearchaeota archaeon]|nr:arginine--tRNA ligase [Candidatus Pacearchaeota archaeon]